MKGSKLGLLLGAVCLIAGRVQGDEPVKVHAVTDIAHEFSFYGDHRFHSQYLPGERGVTNWCSLFNFDFSNANLLILLGCDDRISYFPQDVETIKTFLKSGGGVVLLGGHNARSQGALAKEFGAEFIAGAQMPMRPVEALAGVKEIEGNTSSSLKLEKVKKWDILVTDAAGKPVLAKTKYGKGNLLVGVRGLAGSNPNASDSINYRMWRPLLKAVASGKTINPAAPFRGKGIGDLEHKDKHETFVLSYNDYLKPFADAMVDISKRCQPMIEARMGVPLSKGMGSEISLLATGGGGFSSGSVIALAVWWGDFPDKEDSMIEFITHESVHSWVLPYPEVWNEPIATYVGNLVMIDMGHEAEAMRRIKGQIAAGLKHDPQMNRYDLDGNAIDGSEKLTGGAVRDIHWGKTYWVFEELRKEYPDIVARYFKAKRRLLANQKITRYDMNNTVAVMSAAVGKDLFPWFRQHGFNVDRAKAEVKG